MFSKLLSLGTLLVDDKCKASGCTHGVLAFKNGTKLVWCPACETEYY